ncbi:MAG: TlyA family RNA methyltransferase [Actinomycetales bacterium]|nr:TlyA family RNA methyltransferase [Actinomycetales bacterium]
MTEAGPGAGSEAEAPTGADGGVPARLDVELVRRGLARSRAHARAAIEEGRVEVDGRVATKPAAPTAHSAAIEVRDPDRYVARSAHKLIAALDALAIDPAGRLALDVGASTGGFTQVLLERGAREVIALDVGHDQLVPELRADPRVRVVEGANARELTPASLAELAGTAEAPELVVADVSFIPLGAILPALVAVATPDAEFVLLVKPQFEVGRSAVRAGIVRERAARLEAVRGVGRAMAGLGLGVRGVLSSPILGSAGNREYLLAATRGVGGDPTEWEGALAALD